MQRESDLMYSLVESVDKKESPEIIFNLINYLGLRVRLKFGMMEIKGLHSLLMHHLQKQDVQPFLELMAEMEEDLVIAYLASHNDENVAKLNHAYLNDQKELIIPGDCHGKYRYWKGSESSEWTPLNRPMNLLEILACLNAPIDIVKNYVKWE